MPPKGSGPSKKTEQKAKAKVVEDKTFGLKNKNKSAKVAKFVKTVEQNVMNKGSKQQKKEDEEAKLRMKIKQEEEAKKKEMATLFKPVVQQKVPFGTDPKSVLCAYFKIGACTKGDKCKFSHDVNVERKSAKIDLYTDARRDKDEDTMDKWDQSKLEAVVSSKGKNKATTEIVCKYFLDAIESKKYGWFWECPNGGESCIYRHALPPGFVLKTPGSAANANKGDEEVISLEEFLETERHKLGDNLTPVTLESFTKWKADRKAKKEAEEKAAQKARENEFRAGRLMVSGRDLFSYQPDLFKDDDEAMDVDYTTREDEYEEENEKFKEGNNVNGGIKTGNADHEDKGEVDESVFLEEDLDALEIED